MALTVYRKDNWLKKIFSLLCSIVAGFIVLYAGYKINLHNPSIDYQLILIRAFATLYLATAVAALSVNLTNKFSRKQIARFKFFLLFTSTWAIVLCWDVFINPLPANLLFKMVEKKYAIMALLAILMAFPICWLSNKLFKKLFKS